MLRTKLMLSLLGATAINDASKKLVTDAKAAGKPIIIALDCVEPDAWIIENSAAVLFLNYNVTTDHGTALPNFNRRTAPSVLAEMVFGRLEPTGMLVKEIARQLNRKRLNGATSHSTREHRIM